MSRKEQNDIRKEYKRECNGAYKYSIHLFILYVVVGIISLISLFITSFCGSYISSIVFLINFTILFFILYFLKKSNCNFYKFLDSKGIIYDRKTNYHKKHFNKTVANQKRH